MLKTKHLRTMSKIAFTESAPCERTFCIQKTLKTSKPLAFLFTFYVLQLSAFAVASHLQLTQKV